MKTKLVVDPLKPQSATKAKLPKARPTLKQRREWHPPASSHEIALSRMKTLCKRLRYRGDQYNADIAEMEVLPFLSVLSFPQAGGGK